MGVFNKYLRKHSQGAIIIYKDLCEAVTLLIEFHLNTHTQQT